VVRGRGEQDWLAFGRPQNSSYIPTSPAQGVYTFVVEGEMVCSGTQLERRDSVGIWGAEQLALQTGTTSVDVFFVETVM
jgi:hypothetical protein